MSNGHGGALEYGCCCQIARLDTVISVVSTMTGRPKLRSLRVFCTICFSLPESCMHAGLMLTVSMRRPAGGAIPPRELSVPAGEPADTPVACQGAPAARLRAGPQRRRRPLGRRERRCEFAPHASSRFIRGKDTHGTHIRPELGARGMRGSKPAQGSAEWVSEQRAHSIGLAAAAVLVAPQVHILYAGKTHTRHRAVTA